MDKKPLHLGLHSGLPPLVSEEAALAQWERGPRVLGPSIAQRIIAMGQSSKATKAEKPSEKNRQD